MGVRGTSLDKNCSVDEMRELIYKYGGNIKAIASYCQCARDTIYDFIDIHLELKEDLKKARGRIGDYEVESGYDVIDKLMKSADEDPSNAFKAANLVLTKSSISRYYTEPSGSSSDAQSSIPADIALMAKENYELKEKLKKLEGKSGD